MDFIDFIEKFEMRRVAPHKFLILRTRKREKVRRYAVASGKTHPIEYMKISKRYMLDFINWHGVCIG